MSTRNLKLLKTERLSGEIRLVFNRVLTDDEFKFLKELNERGVCHTPIPKGFTPLIVK